jgi:hypothetical protein
MKTCDHNFNYKFSIKIPTYWITPSTSSSLPYDYWKIDATPKSYVTNELDYSSWTRKSFPYALIFLYVNAMKLGGIERWTRSSLIDKVILSWWVQMTCLTHLAIPLIFCKCGGNMTSWQHVVRFDSQAHSNSTLHLQCVPSHPYIPYIKHEINVMKWWQLIYTYYPWK